MVIQISEKQFKALIKESVKEVFDAELLKLKSLTLPFVSSKEQKEIENKFGKPNRKKFKTYKTKQCRSK